jgi:hypothetical protein
MRENREANAVFGIEELEVVKLFSGERTWQSQRRKAPKAVATCAVSLVEINWP